VPRDKRDADYNKRGETYKMIKEVNGSGNHSREQPRTNIEYF